MRRSGRFFSVLALLFCLGGLAFAARLHSVPLGHRAYGVLSAAETRGLIPQQTDARPYSCDKVLLLLDEMARSGRLAAAELDEVRSVERELERVYGVSPSRTAGEVLRNGFFRAANDEGTVCASAGLQISTVQTLGGKGGFVLDSRNKVKAFVAGDLSDALSFDINFGLLVDKLDYNAFLYNDFRFECEGFYLNPLSKGGPSYLYALPSDKVWIGLAMAPEIDLGFFGGALRLRIGSVRRDWGPGINNLQLSGSASPFEGIDIQIEPFPWLSLSVVNGSLGKFRLLSVGGLPWPSDDYDSKEKMKYDNNLGAQRVELRPCRNLSLAIFESVVYKKRFELGYLNPLSIYMFTQNALGDIDNMLAGVDMSFIWPHVLRAWAAVACTELNSLRNVLTHPRNILAFQGGVEVDLPFPAFGRLALQGVYLSPFFGAHYELKPGENPWNCQYNTDYVNKGVPLTYPMEPDSLECLLVLEGGLGHGWEGGLVAKYQARSAQYATSEKAGTTYGTKMDYSKTGQYKLKDFFGNIFSHILSVGLDVSKAFEGLPLRLRLGLRFEGDWTRAFTIAGADALGNVGCNLGDGTALGEWNAPVYGVLGSLGLQIYY